MSLAFIQGDLVQSDWVQGDAPISSGGGMQWQRRYRGTEPMPVPLHPSELMALRREEEVLALLALNWTDETLFAAIASLN